MKTERRDCVSAVVLERELLCVALGEFGVVSGSDGIDVICWKGHSFYALKVSNCHCHIRINVYHILADTSWVTAVVIPALLQANLEGILQSTQGCDGLSCRSQCFKVDKYRILSGVGVANSLWLNFMNGLCCDNIALVRKCPLTLKSS